MRLSQISLEEAAAILRVSPRDAAQKAYLNGFTLRFDRRFYPHQRYAL